MTGTPAPVTGGSNGARCSLCVAVCELRNCTRCVDNLNKCDVGYCRDGFRLGETGQCERASSANTVVHVHCAMLPANLDLLTRETEP